MIGWLLCAGLVAAGLLNRVPGAHPDGAAHRAEVGLHVRERAAWLVRRDSNDLADLALVHGRTIRIRYAPYLQMGEVLAPEQLVTYPGSLVGDRRAGDVPYRGLPEEVVHVQRVLAFARADTVVEHYDPRLDRATAARLDAVADGVGRLQSGHRIVLVKGPGMPSGTARMMVHDESLYVVDEAVLLGSPAAESGER